MIPKKIHYVWFGEGEKSDKLKYCMESWSKFLPDYEIKEWNERNFPLDYNDFVKKSYEAGKYAFTSDVARLYALFNEGGIYMDTDVEVYQSLDKFLVEPAFTGFEDVNYPVCATMGSEMANPVIKMMLDYYDCIDFVMYDDWKDYINNQETSTCIYSNVLGALKVDRKRINDIQRIPHFTVYPKSYFFTKGEGYTYHSFTGSW